ncbi:ATP-binding cassette domain-containing protein [Paracoccus fistulariae]|uniref:ATP-binding cassette domain-containing protein n=1 Tax=Paracoccus fistulariae TaxID=658446 RepID=A0ABY7SRT2_9RHOB|nr:ATP-binding cassette domain-containing protein [Paracoccus fistulariae]MDB6183083.1 ATP-binding cassette domain-containing protein [Paracoccus fistulariae]WCR09162.1 ATP-binding cassette domain-containing protein [Paracoccus fistulariae]
MIRIDSLDLKRDGQPILQQVTAQIPAGGLTAVIGPNGAGKSTLLHCLAGLLAPDAGQVQVAGADITGMKPQERAHRVALLTQSPAIVPRLSVRDLVAFGRWPHHQGRPRARDHDLVDEALALFDLSALQDRKLDSLSGGQRQRAFVAMAYAQSTPWMLLDEPLAALDPRYARDIMERLHALSRPGPDARGVVIVLHDLGMAARYADWIVGLKDGRLIHSAPRHEAMTTANLSDLFDTGLSVQMLNEHPVVVPV